MLFGAQEDNGTAYLVTSSQRHSGDARFMLLHELSVDYQRPLPNFVRILPPLDKEAPVLFKYEAHYFLLTSGGQQSHALLCPSCSGIVVIGHPAPDALL